jgi:hypothetical protein
MGVRTRRRGEREIPPEAWALLLDEPQAEGHDEWAAFWLQHNSELRDALGTPSLLELWTLHRAEILARWTREPPPGPGPHPRGSARHGRGALRHPVLYPRLLATQAVGAGPPRRLKKLANCVSFPSPCPRDCRQEPTTFSRE